MTSPYGGARGVSLPPGDSAAARLILLFLLAGVTVATIPLVYVYASDSSDDYQGPVFCARCHETEFTAWNGTAHAQAFSDPVFQAEWKAQGSPEVCLQCHTTGLDRFTGEFSFEGVTCEMCHGPGGTMNLNTTATFCSSCHSFSHYPTYREWLESEHSHANVECSTCHDIMSLELKAESSTALCAQCHAEKLEESLQGSHGAEGYVCVDCHMLKLPSDFENGVPAITGHTFLPKVPDPDCESCHEVTLKGHDVWGEGTENCLTCHDSLYMTLLHLLNGTDLAMSESSILCKQCHQEDYYEWDMGIHVGPHDEDKECIDCHYPMEPYVMWNHTMPPLPERTQPAIVSGFPIPPLHMIGTIAVLGGGTIIAYLGTRRGRYRHAE